MLTASNIKSFREERGWSQQDLALRLGIDQATVSRIERGAEPSGPVRRLLEMIVAETSPAPSRESA